LNGECILKMSLTEEKKAKAKSQRRRRSK
jgi:hypothetical protein